MAGSYSRNKGLKAERDLITWLRANGYPQARRYLAGDGKQPGDIEGLGCCVEVKAGARLRLRQWLRQLDEERDGQPGFLVWREPAHPDPATWPVFWVDSKGGLRRTSVKALFADRHGSVTQA